MGCKNSKSTAVEDQTNKDNAPEATENKENGAGSTERDTEVFLTEEEAIAWVKERTHVTDERARKIVKKIDKNEDKKLLQKELTELWEAMKEEQRTMLEVFRQHDTDSSGHLTQDEYYQVLRKLLPDLAEENTNSVLKAFDKDGSGTLSYEEFCFYYASVKMRKDMLAAEFDKLDADDDGLLKRDDVVNMLVAEFMMDQHEADMWCSFVDQNNDNKVSRKEFESIWSNFFK